MQKNKKSIIIGISAIIAYIFLNSFSVTFLNLLHINYSKWSSNTLYLFNICYEIFTLIIIFFILHSTIIKNIKEYFAKPKEFFSKYIKYWFITLGLMYLSNFIILIFTKDIAQNEQSVRALFETNPIFTFILAGLVAPILEELIFRLSIYKIVGKYKYLFIILSGFIFGSMHIIGNINNWTDYLYLIPYSIPGCVFAYTLVKSKNICVPISLHMIHNIFALIIQMLSMI